MPSEPRLYDEYKEFVQEKREAKDGGRIKTVEGGIRADIFDHDENSEYDFSEHDCMICELPEHSQNLIIEDMEAEGNA